MSFCLAARRFGGTAFWRHGILAAQGNKSLFSRILSTAPDIDPGAPSQTAVFAVISGFAVRIISFPVYNCVSKNRRRFRALSAFEKSSLTSAHIRSASRPPLRLLTQGFKARPQLYARALPCFVRRPANRRRPFDFRSEQAIRTSRTSFAPLFLPQHSLKNAFRRLFVEIFSSQDPLAPPPDCTRRRIMRTHELRRAAILCEIFCRSPLGFALAHYARAYCTIPTRRRQRSFIVFSYAFSRVYASVFALICVMLLL